MNGTQCLALASLCAGTVFAGDVPSQAAQTPVLVRTVAGTGLPGNDDGPVDSASFLAPAGIAVAADGTIAVSDAAGQRIRTIRNGVVATLAGGGAIEATGDSVAGAYRDGAASDSRFDAPSALVYLSDGTLLVADEHNHCIRAIRNATVSTFAGNAGTRGTNDGPVASATFEYPAGLAVDRRGDVFVADRSAGLREIRNGAVSTIPLPTTTDGEAVSVAVTGDGATRRIFVATRAGIVTIDGDPAAAPVSYAKVMEGGGHEGYPGSLVALDRDAVAFADSEDQTVRLFRVPMHAGGAPVAESLVQNAIEDGANNGGGFRDGDLRDAKFAFPAAVARNANGDLLVADLGNRRIRSIGGDVLRLPRTTSGGVLPPGRTWIVGGDAAYSDTLWTSSIPGLVSTANGTGRVDALHYDDLDAADIERALEQAIAAKPTDAVWILSTRELTTLGAGRLTRLLTTPSIAAAVSVCVIPVAGDVPSALTFAMLALDPGIDVRTERAKYRTLQQLVHAAPTPSIEVAAQLERYGDDDGGGDPYATNGPSLTDGGREVVAKAIATSLVRRNARRSAPTRHP